MDRVEPVVEPVKVATRLPTHTDMGDTTVGAATRTGDNSLFEAFWSKSLPKPQWTHEAHVSVCWHAVRLWGGSKALEALRRQIRAYNESVGVENTATGGYHETITCYYVGAVTELVRVKPALTLAACLNDPSCTRTAPQQYWTRELLFAAEARAAWLAPDLLPLPWPIEPIFRL